MKIEDGDLVLVAPAAYRAIVMHVDRAWWGDPLKVKVRPIDNDVTSRARNVKVKNIICVLRGKE